MKLEVCSGKSGPTGVHSKYSLTRISCPTSHGAAIGYGTAASHSADQTPTPLLRAV